MRLDKWIKTQDAILKNTYTYVYAEQVDAIFVQICTIISVMFKNFQHYPFDLQLNDFEIDLNGIVKYAPQKVISNHNKNYLGMLLYELLYRKKYRVENLKDTKKEFLIDTLYLENAYQEFDNVMELLISGNDDISWEDFPVSIAKIELIEKETNQILEANTIILENFDEIYCVAKEFRKFGNVYRILENQKQTIGYSFLQKKYLIYYSKIGNELVYENFNGEWGIIAVDKEGKRKFLPFCCKNNNFYLKLDIIPKIFIPYITITLVRRNEKCFETDIDKYSNSFAIYGEILLYSKYDLDTLEKIYIMCEVPDKDAKYLKLKTQLFFENSFSENKENLIQIL